MFRIEPPKGHDGVITHPLWWMGMCKCRGCEHAAYIAASPGVNLVKILCPICGEFKGDIFYGRKHIIESRND